MIKEKTVLVICGPTGSGKTKAALYLSMLLSTNIISADSMQAFKHMIIGTDRQDFEKSFSVKQYMTDICNPDHRLTAVEFRDQARAIIKNKFFARNKIPVIAGGSGLHIRAIIDDLMHAPNTADEIKKKIKEGIKIKGLSYYYNELKKADIEYAKKIGENDKRRIIRALEVYYNTGRKYSDYLINWNERKAIYNTIMLGLNPNRAALYLNIEKRVEKMIADGLLNEVRNLYDLGYAGCRSVSQAIGYKELVRFLEKEITFDEAVEEVKKNTRHLAKKQLTWFKADKRINWIDISQDMSVKELIENILFIINSKVAYERA